MPSKNYLDAYLFYCLLLLPMLVSCSGDSTTPSAPIGSDSLYVWDNIRRYVTTEPERALAMIDTAQALGVADVSHADIMRAQVYVNSPLINDPVKAKDYCLKVLDDPHATIDSAQHVEILILLVAASLQDQENYADAIRYAMEGAKRAHNLGLTDDEAHFYFDLGDAMERHKYGSGIDYMNRSLELVREASRQNIESLPRYSKYLGNTARIHVGERHFDLAQPLLEERLQVIDRLEREYTAAPDGWVDIQKAYTYSMLAFIQWMNGDRKGAWRSAAAFEQTQASQLPDHQMDILFFYAEAGDADHIQHIFQQLEPYYRAQDTISADYYNLLSLYATGLRHTQQYRQACAYQERAALIKDSLLQREQQSELLKYAQLMKTQEKELLLRDEEARSSTYRILLLSLAVVALVIAIALWRVLMAHRRELRKNRQLYDIIQRQEQRQQQDIRQLAQRPAQELSASQQLFLRLTTLMKEQQPYTDSDLNRDSLASLLSTNHRYVDEAIRDCSDSQSTKAYINAHRVEHAARLLSTTDEPIALVAEMSGFANRTSFNTLFREHYKMTPSEYRQAAVG